MQKIIIFGASGNVGSYLAHYAKEFFTDKSYEVIASGRRNTTVFEKEGIPYVSVDITKKDDFEKLPQTDVKAVFLLSSATPSYMANYNPENYLRTNILGTFNVLEYCRKVGCERFIFTQTTYDIWLYDHDEVLKADLPPKFPYTGDHAVYTISKNSAIELIKHYHAEYGLKYYIFRPGTVYCWSDYQYYFPSGVKKMRPLYVMINRALKGEDIEIAFTHTNGQYGEEYHSFVNGQHTTQGGTHQSAFKKYIAETIKDFSGKNFDYADIRNGIVAAISINIQEPLFESQTKIKLGSLSTEPNGGISIDKFVGDFVKEQVDNYLRRTPDVAEAILQKVGESERERKAMAGVAKLARERSKKANLHNRKLRDCKIHFNDSKGERQEESCIFITEGDSASGSITKSRDVLTQAVFSLRGKPLNSYGLTKKIVYENEEFNLLQAALNIEDGLDGLRYNKVIVATDADVDGMHIRLLMITFFLQFFPELIKKGHVYILQTPLFRVRQRRKRIGKERLKALGEENTKGDFITRYCYSEEERLQNIELLGPEPEITRFKGLGEISPDEFRGFIGEDIRLEQVSLHKSDQVAELLEYYMGKNTMERQNFIIDNLVIEEDRADEEEEEKEYKEMTL